MVMIQKSLPSLRSFIMQTAILVILGLVFIIFGILVGCASSDDDSEVGSVGRATSAFLLIIGLILLILALFVPKQNNGHKRLESEAIEKSEDGSRLYANGRLENNMDMNELVLKDYTVTVDKDKISLKEKY
jgi:hypothetical protein